MKPNIEELTSIVIDAGLQIHKDLGPGLLEVVYETVLAETLARRGHEIARQQSIDIRYRDIEIANAFRADLIIDKKLLLEIKSVESLAPVHAKQVLTYLRLTGLPLGLLLNFGAGTFREGIRRLANNHTDFASSRLRANQK